MVGDPGVPKALWRRLDEVGAEQFVPLQIKYLSHVAGQEHIGGTLRIGIGGHVNQREFLRALTADVLHHAVPTLPHPKPEDCITRDERGVGSDQPRRGTSIAPSPMYPPML
jgi:hypothetical protein